MIDFLDPNTWTQDNHEYRIYCDAGLLNYAIVDDMDYWWACRWCWQTIKSSKRGKKHYASRSSGLGERQHRKWTRLYLHIEIMKRTGIAPPTISHRLVHHINGNERDCRRINLEWATTKSNHVGFVGKRCAASGRFVG